MVKVIASSVRKGNVLDVDGKALCRAHRAELPSGQGHAGHAGRHAPASPTGVKVSERYRTTEQVERAFVEDASTPSFMKMAKAPLHEPGS